MGTYGSWCSWRAGQRSPLSRLTHAARAGQGPDGTARVPQHVLGRQRPEQLSCEEFLLSVGPGNSPMMVT